MTETNFVLRNSADGGKELFDACVVPVKCFLAGEPFGEFEQSMYFHRFVRRDVTFWPHGGR